MKLKHKLPNSIPILIGFSLLLIGVAEITALWSLSKVILPIISESSSVVKVQPEPKAAIFRPQLYWLKINNNQIQLAPITTYTASSSLGLALKDSVAQLLGQSPNSQLTTTIPEQTRLLDLQLTKDGIYIDLSQEFSQGGGSSSMIYRVAQVLYTATSINPQTSVFLSIGGQPVNENYPLGGEGLLLDYPLTRQQFARDFLGE